nr:hypothetical protein [Gemmata obscuriglobus]
MTRELIGLHEVLTLDEVATTLPVPGDDARTRGRARERLSGRESSKWVKVHNQKPRPEEPPPRKSGGHTAVHKLLQPKPPNGRTRRYASDVRSSDASAPFLRTAFFPPWSRFSVAEAARHLGHRELLLGDHLDRLELELRRVDLARTSHCGAYLVLGVYTALSLNSGV